MGIIPSDSENGAELSDAMSEVAAKAASIDERAAVAKQDRAVMEQFIEDYRPFLHSRVLKYAQSRDDEKYDELYSSAMMAFYEAIMNFDSERGHFYPFADRVVRARIIDQLRKLYKHEGKFIPLETDADENEGGESVRLSALDELSIRSYERKNQENAVADEVQQFTAELDRWGITMESLVKNSPKHAKLRDTYRKIVECVIKNESIVHTIINKLYFPVKTITEISELPQKTVERARIYCIASLIIKLGDYDVLSDYISGGR